jgi:hypothetical protein
MSKKAKKGKVVMDGKYEIWEGSGSLFYVKKSDRKHPNIRFNGKMNIDGKLCWVTLFKGKGSFNGKNVLNISQGDKVK